MRKSTTARTRGWWGGKHHVFQTRRSRKREAELRLPPLGKSAPIAPMAKTPAARLSKLVAVCLLLTVTPAALAADRYVPVVPGQLPPDCRSHPNEPCLVIVRPPSMVERERASWCARWPDHSDCRIRR
jgi:hypothetical protein